jgi:hypothetical protein
MTQKNKILLALMSLGVLVLLAVPIVVVVTEASSSLVLTGPTEEQLQQGETYDINWTASGMDKVTVTAAGDRTDYPGNDRGEHRIVIAKDVPADQGSIRWKVPFVDAKSFKITVRGFDERENKPVISSKTYSFRPDILKTRSDDGIYIDVRNETRQRLYVLKDNRLDKVYLTSGARSNEYYPRNIHPEKGHDHDGVFEITEKHEVWHSQLFDVDMFWAMRYWSGHFIHGTYPTEYSKLGSPASSGCNRLNREQAKELYDATPVGTRVEIIAK